MHSPPQNAILLAIDTCGSTGSVAIGRVDLGYARTVDILATAELAPRTYAAQLLPAIESALRNAALALTDLGGIVVVNGPGSFTGVRVGVSTAKGLAEGADLPVLAVSRLELLARQGPDDAWAALDAGRSEFYLGLYRGGILESEGLYTLAELIDKARESPGNSRPGDAKHPSSGLPIVICEEHAALLKRGEIPKLIQVTAPTATDALYACAERFRAGDFDDVATLDGNYLRRPDAEKAANRIAVAASQ